MISINTKVSGKKKQTVKKVVVKKTIKVLTTKKIILNKFKVPVKLWKSFGEKGQIVFNNVYDTTFNQIKQSNINHPKQKDLPIEQWKTLCWNFSCEAAWATNDI